MKIKAKLIITLLIAANQITAQSVGINATGVAPDASALLDLSANNKGFLITRVDTASINSPAFGLMTLAPSDSCLYMYSGTKWIGMGGVGCCCQINSVATPPPVSFPCNGTVTQIVDVLNPVTGKIWMDRNLGASQAATSSTDAASYGDLYQWGRCSDGHEKRTSATTTTLSASDTPGNGNFIYNNSNPYDWRNPQNDNLWQGAAGINNPCPTGYRIPTSAELDAERLSWASNNAAGAFGSPLKFPAAGYRQGSNAVLNEAGITGYYMSSTVNGPNINTLYFHSAGLLMFVERRAYGHSVRCIKN